MDWLSIIILILSILGAIIPLILEILKPPVD